MTAARRDEGASPAGAHDEGAPPAGAHDEGAPPAGAHDEGAPPAGAHDEGAPAGGAHDEGAPAARARDEGASPTRTRGADATRARIREAAQAEFAEVGFDGARVDRIAERARANKRMLYLYFGDKEALYVDVLRSSLAEAVQAVDHAGDDLPPGDPVAHVEAAIRGYFRLLAENPRLVRLLGHEWLASGRRAGRLLADAPTLGLDRIAEVFERGRTEGVFRADADVARLALGVSTLCVGLLLRRELVRDAWGSDLDTAAGRQAVEDDVVRLVLDGVRARDDRGAP
jgi:TetR/AcrR family transcriptional regulator